MTKYIYSIGIILFLSSFNGCFEYEDVDFNGVESFNIEDKNLNDMKFKVGLSINNPNPYNIKIKPSSLDIYVNDKYAGKARITNKLVIRKKEAGVYYTLISANGKDIMKAVGGSLKVLFGGNIKVRLKGKVKGGAYGVSKKIDVDFTESISAKDLF
jgi:LEA14-like dessication related protein